MLDLVDGPLDLIDVTALRTFPPAPSFEALAAGAAGQLDNARVRTSGVASDVGTPLPVDVDAAYGATVTPAAFNLANETQMGAGSPVASLVAAGDQADTIRQSVLSYLPQPSLPINLPFVDPPLPPGGALPNAPAPAGPETQQPPS